MSYKKTEHSVRRSINNALSKSNFLKNGDEVCKSAPLKRFVPNIAICLDEDEKNKDNEKTKSFEKTLSQIDSGDEEEYDEKGEVKGQMYYNETQYDDKITDDDNEHNNNINNIYSDESIIKETHSNSSVEPQLEEKVQSSKKANKKEMIDRELLRIINFHLDDKDFEKEYAELDKKLKKKRIHKTAINASDLNNISKNIYYNKVTAPESDYFIPLTLPFFKNEEKKKEKKIRNMFLDSENFFFNVQLPNMLPSTLEQEVNNEQKQPNNEKTVNWERNKEFKNTTYKLSNVNSLPSGKFAKLIIYKNKKIKMKIGDILFDVDEGSTCTFSQEVACHIKDNSEFLFLGNCDRKIVVTPNIEKMIEKKNDITQK